MMRLRTKFTQNKVRRFAFGPQLHIGSLSIFLSDH
jgi:hypothetical protein